MTDEEIEEVVNNCDQQSCKNCKFYNLEGCLSVVNYIRVLKLQIIKKEGIENED